MADTKQRGLAFLQQFNLAKSQRAIWDSQYQDLKNVVRPDGGNFQTQTAQGDRRYNQIYDGTAIHACEEFASGLHSYLTSPTDRWFELGVDTDISQNPEAALWLEDVAEQMYGIYSDSRSNFNPALSELYLDLGAFGTGVILQEWDEDLNFITFRNDNVNQFYFEEDSRGRVCGVYQYFDFTSQQIREKYERDGMLEGTDILKIILLPYNAYKKFKLVRYVGPNANRIPGKLTSKNKAFCSITVVEQTGEVIRDSGYDSLPYAVPRWVKIGGETYGRGPAHKCLPDAMALQTMERTMLKAGQKAVDPPLQIPSEGFMEPISQAPGSLIYKEPGSEEIKALEFKGNLNFGVEQSNQKRAYIEKCFYTEWFKRFHKNREQSATEVLDDRDEMLRFLAPMLGRQQTELLGPLIKRTYELLHERNQIKPAPVILQGRKLSVNYISPAARAQQGVRADRVSRFMQDITPLMQMDQGIVDSLDTNAMVKLYASTRGVSSKIFRTDAAVNAIRQQRAQKQNAMDMAQTAEPASKTLLNLAQAKAAGGGGNPGGPV